MGKIQGNHKAVRALRPEETRGDSSYQNPENKAYREYHQKQDMTFSHPGQSAGR